MAILDWPGHLRPSSMSWTLLSSGSMFESVFNKATQTVTFPGSKWKVSMNFQDLDDFDSRLLESIIVDLDGMGGRIRMGDFGRYGVPPQGTPIISGANQTGKSINTAGWLPDRMILARGQYLTIGDEMKMVLNDAWSDEQGFATIRIGPMLRVSPAAGAPIEVQSPRGIFMLTENENGVDRKPAFSNDFNLSFMEYIE